MKKTNNEIIKKKKLIIILALVIVLLLILTVIVVRSSNKNNEQEIYNQAVIERQETEKKLIIEDLSGKSEQERMEYYCAQFFKYISNRDFESAYDMLYFEYKENYFPTIESFKRYILEYFPSTMSITHNNMERLGNIYVLWINVKDVYDAINGQNFDMNIVIREDAYNDIKLSFSRNSAVEGMEE